MALAVLHSGVRTVPHVDELCVVAAGNPADAADGVSVTQTEYRPPDGALEGGQILHPAP
jgi:hypothetical protein